MLSPLSCVTVAIALLGTLLVYRWLHPSPIPGIPHNPASAKRLLGDAPLLMSHLKTDKTVMTWIIAQSAHLDSPVYQVFLRPFGRPFVVVLDPREITDILVRRSREFDRSKSFRDVFVGTIPDHHISMPTGDRFRAQRMLLADTMTNQFLHKVATPHLREHFLHLMDLWRIKSEVAPGTPFEASSDINRSALDAIWAVTFGTQSNTIKIQKEALARSGSETRTHIDEMGAVVFPEAHVTASYESIKILSDAVEAAVRSVQPRLSHWIRRQTRLWRSARAAKDRLVSAALREAERRMLHPDSTDDTIDCATDHIVLRELRAARKEGRPPAIDTPAIRDELLGFLVAGHDTSATTIQWGVKFLADHPPAQTALRDALRGGHAEARADSVPPSVQAIVGTSVPLLDATIEEILRCGTTLMGTSRVTLADVDILGHRVPKGVDVFLLWGGPGYTRPWTFGDRYAEADRSPSSRAHRQTAVPGWDDTDVARFRPERWLKTGEKGEVVFDGNAGPTRPFGGGIRGCFGRKLAYLELKVFFTLVVWEFELERCPDVLSGYDGIAKLTHAPVSCHVRPRWLGRGTSSIQ